MFSASPSLFEVEISPVLPPALARLQTVAERLDYTWDSRLQALLESLDPDAWRACGHNPRRFLRRASQARVDAAAADANFLATLAALVPDESGDRQHPEVAGALGKDDLIAYFCAEYGLHESLPLYAGGLGILAGDHCKAANDLQLPFVAVGLYYRAGFLRQEIDAEGRQQLRYEAVPDGDLPFEEVCDSAGERLRIGVAMDGRDVQLRAWRGRLGNVDLLLLDSDIEPNTAHDRAITHELYGGDIETRIAQEIVLGVGGARLLRALGLAPTAWHINEGHAAFLVLERVREQVAAGLDFEAALAVVAAGTVFTTHTPVPAGHDVFPHALLLRYLAGWAGMLGVDESRLLALGASPQHPEGFNQTSLALRGSRFHNGVSRVHEGVASSNEGFIWPEIAAAENPLSHVTNGVHAHTWLSDAWARMFDQRLGPQWRGASGDTAPWSRLGELSPRAWWTVRQELKADLLAELQLRLGRQYARHGLPPAAIARRLALLDQARAPLLVGFARRFATYKRATLLLTDPARLAALLGDDERPVVLLFAGKAHPRDIGGQELIRALHEHAASPAFAGRLHLIEDYGIALARRLVRGVDVWLNNPEYPMEASGTSGMKAAMNGAVHLSILDGWWAEGYTGDNGYGIWPTSHRLPEPERNRLEAEEICQVLFEEVKPAFFERDAEGLPRRWIALARRAQETALPQFNASRQVLQYTTNFYAPAARLARRLAADRGAGARALAAWKSRALAAWPGVHLTLVQGPPPGVQAGQAFELVVAATLAGLEPGDLHVECQLGTVDEHGVFHEAAGLALQADAHGAGESHHYRARIEPDASGLIRLRIRAWPMHPDLAHRFELGLLRWV